MHKKLFILSLGLIFVCTALVFAIGWSQRKSEVIDTQSSPLQTPNYDATANETVREMDSDGTEIVREPSNTLNKRAVELNDILLPNSEVVWEPEERTTYTVFVDGEDMHLTGSLRRGIVEGSYPETFSQEDLKIPDWQLSTGATGPGGERLEYTKAENGKTRFLIYTYANKDLRPAPQGGMTAHCPCTWAIEVFLSDPH